MSYKYTCKNIILDDIIHNRDLSVPFSYWHLVHVNPTRTWSKTARYIAINTMSCISEIKLRADIEHDLSTLID